MHIQLKYYQVLSSTYKDMAGCFHGLEFPWKQNVSHVVHFRQNFFSRSLAAKGARRTFDKLIAVTGYALPKSFYGTTQHF